MRVGHHEVVGRRHSHGGDVRELTLIEIVVQGRYLGSLLMLDVMVNVGVTIRSQNVRCWHAQRSSVV